MPLLNPPNALPQVGFYAARILSAVPGHRLPWEELLHRLAPTQVTSTAHKDPSTAVANDPVNSSLRVLRDVGVLSFSDDVELAAAFLLPHTTRREAKTRYVSALRQAIFNSYDTDSTWEDSDAATGPYDFVRSLAWFLLQDGSRPAFFPNPRGGDSHEEWLDLEQLRISQVGTPDGQVLHNYERWQSFTRWAGFLGFASGAVVGGSTSAVFVDPTGAVLSELEGEPGAREPLGDFLDRLRQRLPVLPGGPISRTVESRLEGRSVGPREVSSSLAVCLLTLDAQKHLRLLRTADAEDDWFFETSPDRLGVRDLTYTHVEWTT